MTPVVLAAVLGSAAMHGAWNAIAKAIPDRLASSTLIGLVYLIGGAAGCIWAPAPSPQAWPALGLSALLQTAYLILLTAAYAHSDFSVAYPATRGIAVVGVTALAVGVLGERPTPAQATGVALVVGALFALAIGRRGRPHTRIGLTLVVAVGLCVTAYTFIDGIGVRASGTALGYAAWLFLLQGITLPLCCLVLSRDRPALLRAVREHAPIGALGGVLSLTAYGIVLWAQASAPLALVSALRETGVIAAGLIGMLLFGERPGVIGFAATAVAAAGILVIRIGV